MNVKLAIWVLLGVVVICGFPLTASAGGGSPFSFGVVATGAYVPPSVFVQENLPYYALYPPVYYSYPTRVSYGFTPFAWGPYGYSPGAYCRNVSAAKAPPRAPVVIRNTHVRANKAVEPAVSQSVVKPLRVVNPFVSPAKYTRTTTPSARMARRPHVIHPASLAGLSE